jgi:hypothetical protein
MNAIDVMLGLGLYSADTWTILTLLQRPLKAYHLIGIGGAGLTICQRRRNIVCALKHRLWTKIILDLFVF